MNNKSKNILSFLLIIFLVVPFYFVGAEENVVEDVINRVRDWIVIVSGALAILMYVVAGFLWMSDAGNAERSKLAKSIMVSATIGLIIVLMAVGISGIVTDIVEGGE